MAATKQNYIIVVGGSDKNAKIIEKYDPYSNRNPWEVIYNFTESIRHFSSVLIDEKLYLFGGWFNNEITNKAWYFDLSKKELTELSSMQEAKYCTTASVVGNYIFIIGGINEENQVLDTIERWDINNKTSKILEKKMTLKRHSHAAVVNDDRIFVIGGYDGENVLKNVESYSIEKDTWQDVDSMKSNRVNLAAVTVGNLIYAIGGSVSLDGEDGLKAVDSVECLNININKWDYVGNLTKPLKGHSAVVEKGRIICFGDATSNLVLEYMFSNKEWVEIREMKNKRQYYQVFSTNFNFSQVEQKGQENNVVLNRDNNLSNKNVTDQISHIDIELKKMLQASDYFSLPSVPTLVETMNSNDLPNDLSLQKKEKIALVGGFKIEIANAVDIYDVESNCWTRSEYIGINKYNFASVVVEDWIVIIGGQNSSKQILISVEYIDLKNGQKHQLNPLNQSRYLFSAVTHRKDSSTDVYAIGGSINTNDKSLSSVERWNSKTKNWDTNIASLLVGVSRHSASVANDRIYVTGGCMQEKEGISPINKVQMYSMEFNSWSYCAPMIHGRCDHSSVEFNGKLFVAGGRSVMKGVTEENNNTGVFYLESVEIYDPNTDLWTASYNLPKPVIEISLCCFQRKLFCMGGQDKKSSNLCVWEYDKGWTNSKNLNKERRASSALVIPDFSIFRPVREN
ncbi:uncharacterized protein LOC143916780 [Arctopsyche grandis]|uniref:uncharacterized protein LOC143916780 n=1 Tax=Arctopsyche grandis TaxID=121162 RepID=UPI00406D9E83